MATHTDPVCGMQVEEENFAGTSEYKRTTIISVRKATNRSSTQTLSSMPDKPRKRDRT